MQKENQKNVVPKGKGETDKVIFFICLFFSILLAVGGFLTPPTGVIDGSVLTAMGILFGFAALAVGAQALYNGRSLRVEKDDITITVGENEEN